MKKIREVKCRSVLVFAVDSSQVSWAMEHGTYFAREIEKVINENATEYAPADCLTFTDLTIKLKECSGAHTHCPKQNCSISASFKLDEKDKLCEKRNFNWIKTEIDLRK